MTKGKPGVGARLWLALGAFWSVFWHGTVKVDALWHPKLIEVRGRKAVRRPVVEHGEVQRRREALRRESRMTLPSRSRKG